MGPVSNDGPGQQNPDQSEGPWGRAIPVARMAVLIRATPPTLNGDPRFANGEHEGWTQTKRRDTWTPLGRPDLTGQP